jgi:hypothetical protein
MFIPFRPALLFPCGYSTSSSTRSLIYRTLQGIIDIILPNRITRSPSATLSIDQRVPGHWSFPTLFPSSSCPLLPFFLIASPGKNSPPLPACVVSTCYTLICRWMFVFSRSASVLTPLALLCFLICLSRSSTGSSHSPPPRTHFISHTFDWLTNARLFPTRSFPSPPVFSFSLFFLIAFRGEHHHSVPPHGVSTSHSSYWPRLPGRSRTPMIIRLLPSVRSLIAFFDNIHLLTYF